MSILLALVAVVGQAQNTVGTLADTYWRNEKTGDWLIGITANHVIYDNMVWDIVARTEKKDAYTLTISNGTTIKVGKQKKGLRSIAIDKQKPITCSLINTEALPDYPKKDLRTGFTDNGYRDGDSVTIIGWLKDMPQEEWQKGGEFRVSVEQHHHRRARGILCQDGLFGPLHAPLSHHQHLGSVVRRAPHGHYECCRAWRDLLLPVRLQNGAEAMDGQQRAVAKRTAGLSLGWSSRPH